MSSRATIALSAAVMMAAVNAGLAQQGNGGLLPAPSAPVRVVQEPGPALHGANAGAAVEAPQSTAIPADAVEPAHDGWGGTVTGSIERGPLSAPTPEAIPDTPDPAAASSLERHLDSVQDLLTDQENVRPDMVEKAEKLEWDQMDEALEDGDFAEANSAEKQIGWTAKGKNGNRPKLRRSKVDVKSLTRLKLNESGSTVLDITKGRVVTRF